MGSEYIYHFTRKRLFRLSVLNTVFELKGTTAGGQTSYGFWGPIVSKEWILRDVMKAKKRGKLLDARQALEVLIKNRTPSELVQAFFKQEINL